MKEPPLSWLRGTVALHISGKRIEGLINAVNEAGIIIWNVKATESGVSLRLLLNDFYALRPLLKQTGCRMHITGRIGLPFVAARLWKRSFFAAGLVLFGIILVLLCSLVWSVRVEGNKRLASEDVLDAARQEGIYPFQWIWRMDSPDKLSKHLAARLPGVSWVGIERNGTAVKIQIVEAALPEKKPLSSPRHLISRTDAVITDIYAEQGRPVVQRNARVKKGDILISGILGDEANRQAVVAKGEVKGLVWHEYNIEVPLQKKNTAYTGERKDRSYFVLGKWAVQLWGYGKSPFEESRTLTELDPLTWRTIRLPIGWMTEKEMEVKETRETLTPQAAKQAGLALSEADIAARYGSDSVIKSQKILHEKKENGKVYMKVLFEVEERIAEELPIVYNQGE
ncbi:similar to stage IV sporulation protein [Paenibacillus sophorae]|uniref:Similar to stage IV sporulation protein n=1 Tax=Paenibacillus sophorae TaxID=1333845 RepID=A0A1H8R8X9_9BACL|nr:sporulation protein YqfD [Paenibacillus sophorae]QWU14989.1 sporulation protein YqfD [Paenibacillus sophorae]SEO62747.1 similar to stage IV sporulation protein [Paenibacillus sophorae]